MRIAHLDVKVAGIKHTASFDMYPQIISGKVEQTKQRMRELGMDKSERYIIYEPKRGPDHEHGFFMTGVAVEDGVGEIPVDMELIHLRGSYAVLETMFDPSRMGEYYDQLDRMIEQSDYRHALDRFIVELYKELDDGSQKLLISMPVAKV